MFLTFVPMKKRQVIINFSLTIAVLFSILFQSFHSYEHLSKQLSEKVCHHKYNHHKTEINHQHKGFDHCFLCEFTLSSFIATDISVFEYKSVLFSSVNFLYFSNENIQFFKGSLFSLRAPPSFIV